MDQSPYSKLAVGQWAERTAELIDAHPLSKEEIVEIVLMAWEAIFDSRIGPREFQIETHIFPKPQIMGFFLHELIPLELATRHPGEWRGDITADEKDLVYLPRPEFSTEVKTSSHRTQIFGNRSYAQKPSDSKKSKGGYYLAVNFEKFEKGKSARPQIRRIRFGWLEHTDWIGQAAATGQQAHLNPDSEGKKLLILYDAS